MMCLIQGVVDPDIVRGVGQGILLKVKGKQPDRNQKPHLYSGTLPTWEREGEMVCSADGLGQHVRVCR